MRRFLLIAWLAVACFAAFACSTADAAIVSRDWLAPGDNLLTLDSATGREWLDLTETALPDGDAGDLPERFGDFLSRLAPGGDLAGFQVATNDDVYELAESSGIDASTTSIERNGAPAATLATFATTPTTLIDFDNNLYAYGRTANPFLDGFSVQYVPRSRNAPIASVFSVPHGTGVMPVWVYREAVPEPASLTLSFVLAQALTLRTRGAKSNLQGVQHASSTPLRNHEESRTLLRAT